MTLTLERISEDLSRLFPRDPSAAACGTASRAIAVEATDSAKAVAAAPAAPVPSPAAPQAGCVAVDYAVKGYHLDVTVSPEQVVAAASLLDQLGFAIDAITGVDWMAQDQMEIVYDYFHPMAAWRVAVRCRVSRGNPEVSTISGVFPGANWHEREAGEFFGICFLGHPQLTPLLLPEDADYHPLRKDFKA